MMYVKPFGLYSLYFQELIKLFSRIRIMRSLLNYAQKYEIKPKTAQKYKSWKINYRNLKSRETIENTAMHILAIFKFQNALIESCLPISEFSKEHNL